MRKWFLLLAALLLMAVFYYRFTAPPDFEPPTEQADSGNEPNTPVKETGPPPKIELAIPVDAGQVHEGDLLLVNEQIAVPPNDADAEAVNLYQHKELLDGFGLLDNSIRLSPDLTHKFAAMIKDAAKVGVNHFLINSGYRNDKEQQVLYDQLGPEIAALPGHSEHSLGLALDIGSTKAQMKDAPEGVWLRENAWKYGFIVRYPEDKTDITDVIDEPWHFRYVGLPHSAIMQENHWAFEEYLHELKVRQSITAVVGNQTYVVYYFPVTSNTTLHVPTIGSYELSGNNTDGVIVTVRKSSSMADAELVPN
ncbi:M15 family metallopeptidase [Paenibacillus sacheonensis]|uniref:D-Ala-D-Ala carboxypeptidase VanY n=1 Tax=Paenibacillus sacheonensis TaxID=742054 RepID=A0A7X4YS42_9BACL|nr:M15 family metallopeptidase [Paenibacillus sacheonensis]MBM7566320.1 D-alanyl-D-alanine carboxypeptidase [Paenibacillus sacheonensis]NBC70524.1 D-Ala-D-Ala carboxypeptidase VanY [Paenibacillus sacheonensis]